VRERLLTRHFLGRFLDNDLVSPDGDRHAAIAMIGGGLLTLGLFVSVLMSMGFLFMPLQSPGRTADLALYHRFFFSAVSTIVMALVAVATWDALSIDPRDTTILGTLPVPRGMIVRAKLRAIAIVGAGGSLALSALSSLFHPVFMVAKLPIGAFTPLLLVLIHLAVTLTAGLFAFSAIVAIRELFRAVLGPRFTRVSAQLQAVLIVSVITSFLLLPATLARATRAEGHVARLMPPVWFVGLHETLAGTLIAGLPPRELPRRFQREEDAAIARYRANAARLEPLGWRAAAGFIGAILLAIAGYYWNSRQLPLPLVGGRRSRFRVRDALARVVTLVLVRRPMAQAGFFLTLHSLFRSAPHRVVMSACSAVSLALAILILAGVSRSIARNPGILPASAFSTQTIALMVMLFGFRHVTRVPADVSGNKLFRLSWVGNGEAFLAGVRRAALLGVVVPVVLLLLPANLYLLGQEKACMHAVSGVLLGGVFLSVLTSRATNLPFVASYGPTPDLNTVGPAVLIGGFFAISVFSRIEHYAMSDLDSAAIFWGVLVTAAIIPRLARDRGAWLDLPTAFDVPAGTTHLDLG
jgi:hypothetical protein